jgi:hypothetical protein
MKRFDPVLKADDYGCHYVDMEETPNGKYVLAEEAYEENNDYQWSHKKGRWIKKFRDKPTTTEGNK